MNCRLRSKIAWSQSVPIVLPVHAGWPLDFCDCCCGGLLACTNVGVGRHRVSHMTAVVIEVGGALAGGALLVGSVQTRCSMFVMQFVFCLGF